MKKNVYLDLNQQVFQGGKGEKRIRKSPRADKYTKAPSKKTSSLHEEGSDYSLASSIITLSDKSANKNETAYNKKELSSDDLVHQNNAAVSANIVENNVKTRFFVHVIDKNTFSNKSDTIHQCFHVQLLYKDVKR